MTPRDLLDWMEEMGLSQTQASFRLGISRTTLAKYIAGTRDIPIVVGLSCTALYHRMTPWSTRHPRTLAPLPRPRR